MSQNKSSAEEVRYWKDRAEELERELEDFREQSEGLERELEASLEQADKLAHDLKIRCNKLQLENDTLKVAVHLLHDLVTVLFSFSNLSIVISPQDKLEHIHKESSNQITELQAEVAQCRSHEEKLVKYIRELEQKNDDLERTQRYCLQDINQIKVYTNRERRISNVFPFCRAMYVSLGDFETKMNLAIERNALLESELDEKESLQAMVQRLKDEARGKRLFISILKFLLS